ncbi:MAG: hypothetical protein ACTTGJ_04155 [Clostridium sp.]
MGVTRALNLSKELLKNLNLTEEEKQELNQTKKVKLFLNSLENFKKFNNDSKYLEEKNIPFSLECLPMFKFRLRRLEDFSFNNIRYKGIYAVEKIEKQNPKETEILEFIQLFSFREIQEIKKGVEIFFTYLN